MVRTTHAGRACELRKSELWGVWGGGKLSLARWQGTGKTQLWLPCTSALPPPAWSPLTSWLLTATVSRRQPTPARMRLDSLSLCLPPLGLPLAGQLWRLAGNAGLGIACHTPAETHHVLLLCHWREEERERPQSPLARAHASKMLRLRTVARRLPGGQHAAASVPPSPAGHTSKVLWIKARQIARVDGMGLTEPASGSSGW